MYRINRFAQLLNMDPYRIAQWSYVQAILAAVWALQDKQDPQKWLVVAQEISNIYK